MNASSNNDHCPDALHSLFSQMQYLQQQSQANVRWDCLMNGGQIEHATKQMPSENTCQV